MLDDVALLTLAVSDTNLKRNGSAGQRLGILNLSRVTLFRAKHVPIGLANPLVAFQPIEPLPGPVKAEVGPLASLIENRVGHDLQQLLSEAKLLIELARGRLHRRDVGTRHENANNLTGLSFQRCRGKTNVDTPSVGTRLPFYFTSRDRLARHYACVQINRKAT